MECGFVYTEAKTKKEQVMYKNIFKNKVKNLLIDKKRVSNKFIFCTYFLNFELQKLS